MHKIIATTVLLIAGLFTVGAAGKDAVGNDAIQPIRIEANESPLSDMNILSAVLIYNCGENVMIVYMYQHEKHLQHVGMYFLSKWNYPNPKEYADMVGKIEPMIGKDPLFHRYEMNRTCSKS